MYQVKARSEGLNRDGMCGARHKTHSVLQFFVWLRIAVTGGCCAWRALGSRGESPAFKEDPTPHKGTKHHMRPHASVYT